ncbi:hypothetical protein A1359_03390 [Methylomonas lenta]|uniref:Glycosyltransferase 2-like domain-containing protein n=1 Tax=Methylomonas lenta TaxID=980561 RepID=A0A177NRC3_9GAMM|nr:glycosyltransferase [Methylomonas lenta]OAI20515.1 hypothetical protein A1359_03390 [Methylomonas lenta]
MDLSIIICTYNRYQNLDECFNCLDQQKLKHNLSWEIILVDNNSSDATKAVVEDYAKTTKLDIHYVFEGKQGLSIARNTGIKYSTGNYIVFIDDDIRVTPTWLNSIYSTFVEHNCDAVGGRIHLESTENLPKWITPDMCGFLGHQDFGSSPRLMDGISEFPFGGNMAIQRRVIDLIGNFDTDLGRKGEGLKKDELFKGEETDFFQRLANAGGKFYYHPDALVFHKILPHQLTKRFFLTLHHNAGIQTALQDTMQYKRQILGIPFFIIPQFLRSIYHYILLSNKNGLSGSFRQLMNVYYFAGTMTGYFKKNTNNIK